MTARYHEVIAELSGKVEAVLSLTSLTDKVAIGMLRCSVVVIDIVGTAQLEMTVVARDEAAQELQG